MDCGSPEFKGEGVEEVYKTLMFTEYPSTKEKREKRLKDFSRKQRLHDAEVEAQRAINSTVE